MPIAVFGTKSFQVSSNKIYTFDGFKLSGDLQTEAQDLAGQKPSTYIKGPGLESISFSIILDSCFGIDVMQEINDWRAIRDAAVPQVFILGTTPLSKNKWLLKSVEVDAKVIDSNGNIHKAILTLSFEEYVRPGSAQVSQSGNIVGNLAPAILDTSNFINDKTDKKRQNANVAYAIFKGAGGGKALLEG